MRQLIAHTAKPADRLRDRAGLSRSHYSERHAPRPPREGEGTENRETANSLHPGFDFSQVPVHGRAPVRIQAKLTINTPGDVFEQEADRVAEQVMRMREPALPGACACGGTCSKCAEVQNTSAQIQMRRIPMDPARSDGASAPPVVHDVLHSNGNALDGETRSFMESRFGHDFSTVRVHADQRAANSADALGAQAYAVGNHLVFGVGQYAPHTKQGLRLLSHELAHTVQQTGRASVLQRRPTKPPKKEPDPLCDTFDLKVSKGAVDAATADLKGATSNVQKRHSLVRAIKPILRCATADEIKDVETGLTSALGAEQTKALWSEAHSAFGGYSGMYPGYARDMKTRLGNLGVKDRVAYDPYTIPDYDNDVPAKPADVKKGADKAAADLGSIDVLYFRGHQFAQYQAPGVFTESDYNNAIDFRYIKKKGGFGNVKIVISTSCATLCKEAFEVFHGLFPKAILLGFRKSAPLDGGKVRNTFEAKVKALKRPLLLDQQVDLGAIVAAWKSTVQGAFAGSDSLPGYYDGQLHYFDGKKWQTLSPTSAGNKCRVKGDETAVFPAP